MTIPKTYLIIAALCLIVGLICGWFLKPTSIIQTQGGTSRVTVIKVKTDTLWIVKPSATVHISGQGSITMDKINLQPVSFGVTNKDTNETPTCLPKDGLLFNCSIFNQNGLYIDTVKVSDVNQFILTMPFHSDFESIVDKDTFNIKYKFPANTFDMAWKPKPDSIMKVNIYTEVEKPIPWYRSDYAIGGYCIGAAVIGAVIRGSK